MVDRAGATGEKDVRVRVLNVNEAGSLTITPEQPLAGQPVVATLTDPDGIVAITDWTWATSSAAFNGSPEGGFVSGASSGSYVGAVGEFLRVTVRYRDGASVEDDPMTAFDERNDDPGTPPEVAIETGFDSDEMLSAGTRYAVQSVKPAESPSTPGQADAAPVTIDLEVAENTPGTGYAGLPVSGLSIRKTTGGLDNGMFVFAEDHDARGDGYYDDALAPDAGHGRQGRPAGPQTGHSPRLRGRRQRLRPRAAGGRRRPRRGRLHRQRQDHRRQRASIHSAEVHWS